MPFQCQSRRIPASKDIRSRPIPNKNLPMKNNHIPFAAGVVGWILGLFVILGLAWPLTSPDTVSTAVMWAIGYWWAAYSFGLVLLVITALIKKAPLQPSLLGYIVPVAVMAALALACLWIYPNSGFREELMSYMPVAVVFYLLSLLWVTLRKPTETKGDLLRTVVPPLFGGIMILALVAVPVFTSNAFIYRNAFAFDVLEVKHPEKSMVAKCLLVIHKPGDYEFRAPSFYYFDMMDPDTADGTNAPTSTINWGEAGKPAAGATGKFPLEIHWNNIPAIAKADLEAMMADALPILLEARSAAQPEQILYTVSAEGAEQESAGQ